MKEAFEKIKERLAEKIVKWFGIWKDALREGETDNYADGMNDAFDEAIKIVSEVEAEYEKDVCEWRWGIDRAMVQCKGDYIIFESRRLFSFCPYCGKEIKEVE